MLQKFTACLIFCLLFVALAGLSACTEPMEQVSPDKPSTQFPTENTPPAQPTPAVPQPTGKKPELLTFPIPQDNTLALLGDGIIRDCAGNVISQEDVANHTRYTIGQVQYWQKAISDEQHFDPIGLVLLQTNDALQAFAAEHNLTEGYAHYTSDFFADKDLLLLTFRTSSRGSVGYTVNGLTRNENGTLYLEFTQIPSTNMTDASRDWQFAIPVPKGAIQQGEEMYLRENTESIGRRIHTVENVLYFSSPLDSLYSDPLSYPFLLYGSELAAFARLCSVTEQYAELIKTTADDQVLLVVPVDSHLRCADISLSYDYDRDDDILHLNLYRHLGAEGEQTERYAYHLIVPIKIHGGKLPQIHMTEQMEQAPPPEQFHAVDTQTLCIGNWYERANAILSPCLRSTDDLALLLRICGIEPLYFWNRLPRNLTFKLYNRQEYYHILDMLLLYDDAFFAENDLLLIPVAASSSSTLFEVKAVEMTDRGVLVTYATLSGGFNVDTTDDATYCTYLIPTKKGTLTEFDHVDSHRTASYESGAIQIQAPTARGLE